MTLTVTHSARAWPFREAFVLARGARQVAETLVLTVRRSSGEIGRGEACGVPYAGESPASMAAQVDAHGSELPDDLSREDLLTAMAPGGARAALDAALWDLEAKAAGVSAFELAGVTADPVITAYTLGIRSLAAYEATAEAYAGWPRLKIKVDAADPVAAVRAVRRGAPAADLIVDPNQAWSLEALKSWAPAMADLGVTLLEQPIAVGQEAGLDGYACPVRLCADELIQDAGDLARAEGRFQVVNIKLDKAGGLTAALELARAARERGFGLMVGCMAGSSLSIAPALVLAQQCEIADLDAALLLAEDWPDGLVCERGVIAPPQRSLWG